MDTVNVPDRGKGRVVARKTGLASVSQPNDVVSVSEAALRQQLDEPRYAEWLSSGSLSALDLTKQQHADQLRTAMRAAEPMLTAKHNIGLAALSATWTLQHLAQRAAQQLLDIWVSHDKRDRVLVPDVDKNVFGSCYHVRETECQAAQQTLPHLAESIGTWRQRKLSASVPIASALTPGSAAWQPIPNEGWEGLSADLQQHIAWDRLKDLQAVHRLGSRCLIHLQLASPGLLLPAQYAVSDRLLCQVRGRVRVLLIPPEHAFRGAYAYPLHHPYDTYMMPDLEAPELQAWPGLQAVRGRVCILEPGSSLFVPAYWYVHAEFLSGDPHVSLAIRFSPGQRLKARSALALQLSRRVEEQLGCCVLPSQLRDTICAICDQQDHNIVDTGTVDGFRRALVYQEIRDEVDGVLGFGVSTRLLAAMCCCRLEPTPWLNEMFREPLYLQDQPKLYIDDRTDEERKFPALFRQQIEQKREARVPYVPALRIASSAGMQLLEAPPAANASFVEAA